MLSGGFDVADGQADVERRMMFFMVLSFQEGRVGSVLLIGLWGMAKILSSPKPLLREPKAARKVLHEHVMARAAVQQS